MCDSTTCVELIYIFQETLTLHQVKNEVSGGNKVADFLACGFRFFFSFSFGGFVFLIFLYLHLGDLQGKM